MKAIGNGIVKLEPAPSSRAVKGLNQHSIYSHMSGPERKKCGKGRGRVVDCLLTVTLWCALVDSEMTGQQVRQQRWAMRGWEVSGLDE
jgi:hypothetical protein